MATIPILLIIFAATVSQFPTPVSATEIPIALPADFIPLDRHILPKWSYEVNLPYDIVTALRHHALKYVSEWDRRRKLISAKTLCDLLTGNEIQEFLNAYNIEVNDPDEFAQYSNSTEGNMKRHTALLNLYVNSFPCMKSRLVLMRKMCPITIDLLEKDCTERERAARRAREL